MKLPVIPHDEKKRLQELRSYGVLDTVPELAFDQITSLAASLCGTKVALVSLVDEDREWFKSCYGTKLNDIPRIQSFCAYVILQDDIFIVPDTLQDPRFKDHPLVTGLPHIRFYTGVPLITPTGAHLGALCVGDIVPKELSSSQKDGLRGLARLVVDLLELRKKTHQVESFQRIIDQTSDALMGLAPPDWKFTFANPSTLKFFGATAEEFFNLGPWDVSPDRQPDGELSAIKAQRMISEAMDKGAHFFEWCHKKLDGTVIPCTVLLSRIDQENQPFLLACVRDVTKEKALERQLMEAQSISKVGSWHFDVLMNEVTWSPETYKIYEIEPGQDKDKLYFKFREKVHPDDLSRLDQYVNRAINNGEGYTFDHRAVLDGGARIKYIQSIAKVTKDDSGKVTAISGSTRDRTADVETEEKFRRLLEENQFVLNSLEIGVWKADMIQGRQIWDKNVYQLFEVDPDKFSHTYADWLNFLTPESRNFVEGEWGKIVEGADRFSHNLEIITPNGKRKHIGTQGMVIRDINGKPIMLYGINWDRTKEVELEKNLEFERAKSLHSAKLASIGQLAAGVGHEINNPLAVISGQIAMAEQQIINGAPMNVIIDKLHKMERSAERITNIVNGLRTFARSDSAEITDFSPQQLVKDSIDLVREIYQHEGVTITLTLESIPPYMRGNMGRLQQVLVNLLSNAKDATMGKPNRLISVRVDSIKDNLRIIVKDNGQGIPENIREKIFDPFFTTKDVSHGTGIGLSLVNTIIKEHNGKIELRSEVGKGTEFEVQVPLGDVSRPMPSAPARARQQTPKLKCRILVVDDEPELREVLKEALEISCEKVFSATTVDEAMKLIKAHNINTVLSDIKMPLMDGFDLLARIRKDPELKNVHFYFITGGIEMSPEEKVIVARDTQGVFYKPVKFSEITQTLRGHYPLIES
jgi:PAS domain S-box-containing protein